ncbi:hypothetical protein Bca52824_083377 [Brassica carinata]|uniref:Uncharacterized protein n=1 Tax=Brassica carinata TaxID=52824 RepID=A0A8X7PK36_BRACI|nr:hypothetical protein Bca52824_083377 [Brassica carinata]
MTCSQRMVAVKVRFAVTLPRSASSCDGRLRNPVIVCLQTLLAAWGIAATSSWPRLDPSAKLLRDQASSMTLAASSSSRDHHSKLVAILHHGIYGPSRLLPAVLKSTVVVVLIVGIKLAVVNKIRR